jgi:hypothetical protein
MCENNHADIAMAAFHPLRTLERAVNLQRGEVMAVKTFVQENPAIRGTLVAAFILVLPTVNWLQGCSVETVIVSGIGAAAIVLLAPDVSTRVKQHPLWQRRIISLLILAAVLYTLVVR